MIEIQCTSCHTRYRIDERVLPDETPTFKCSRCGHVFNADPVGGKMRRPAPPIEETEPDEPVPPPPRPRASVPKARVEPAAAASGAALRESEPPATPSVEEKPPRVEEPASQESAAPAIDDSAGGAFPQISKDDGTVSKAEDSTEHPLDRSFGKSFGDREQKADTGENLKFDFSRESHVLDASHDEHEIPVGRADDEPGWEVGAPEDEPGGGFRSRSQTLAIEPEASVRPYFADREAIRSGAFQIGEPTGEDVEDAAAIAGAGKIHASGFFFLLYFLSRLDSLGRAH